MASNLRLRENDKLKIVPISQGKEMQEERSGDMLLVSTKPTVLSSVTFSPVEDSYNNLVASEGGDDIEDEELKARFIDSYLNLDGDSSGNVVVKQWNVLSIRDENGKTLDFIVSNVSGANTEAEEEEDGEYL